MPLATPAATAAAAAAAAAAAEASSNAPSPVSTLASAAAPLSAAAMESVKRKGLQLSSEIKQFVTAMARPRESPDVSIPLEFKLLAALVVLFLFLLFLIAVLWDRYGKEIGELYTPTGASAAAGSGDAHDVHPNTVADEYTVYQKLPTFFYEYMPRKKQQ